MPNSADPDQLASPSSFKSTGPSVLEKKFKIAFQDGDCGDHLRFQIRTSLAIVDQQVTRYFLLSLESMRTEVQNGFSRWRPSWISNQNDFSYFWSANQLTLPTQFWVNWPFGSEVQYRFSNLQMWYQDHLWYPIQTILVIFHLQLTLMLPTNFCINWPTIQERKHKIKFQASCHGGHFGFWIRTILATGIFDLQVTLIFPTEYPVSRPFSSGEVQNRFSRCPPWQPSFISNQNDLGYFWFQASCHDTILDFKSEPFTVQEKKLKTYFQDGRHDGHLGFLFGKILTIFSIYKSPW